MKKTVICTAIVMFCCLSLNLFAQSQGGGGGQVSQALRGYYTTFVTIGNLLFGIFMLFGVVKVVGSFISDSQFSMKNLLYLIIGAAIWFGFNLIVNDVQSTSGSSTGGYTITK